jgi:hypothetical protein
MLPIEIINLLENDKSLLKFKFQNNSVIIWPLIRHDIITQINNELNSLDYIASNKTIKIYDILKTLFFSVIKCPLFIKKSKIIFFNSGITNIKLENGIYFNRVTDYFHLCHNQNSVLIESTSNKSQLLPRFHQQVYSSFFFDIITQFILFINRKKQLIQSCEIDTLYDQVTSKINFKINKNNFKRIVNNNILKYHYSYNLYIYFFKIKKPKLLFVEDGSYGNKSYIIRAAKKLKIPTVEIQHGFISENHIAYNFGTKIIDEIEFKSYFPDYILLYGQFWSNMINHLSTKISIGNPYLEEKIKEIGIYKQMNSILFLSSGVTKNESISFLLNLMAVLKYKKTKIIFRPHPLEKNNAKNNYKELFENGIELDTNNDLYMSIRNSNIIIGEITTALFEAAALKKKIYLFNSSYTKLYNNKSITFQVIDEHNIHHILINEYKENDDSDYYWEKDWEVKYRNFIRPYLSNL